MIEPDATEPTRIDALRVKVTRPWVSAVLGWSAFFLALLPLFVVMLAAGVLNWSKPTWWGAFMAVSWLSAVASGVAALVAASAPWRSWMHARVAVATGGLLIEPKQLVAGAREAAAETLDAAVCNSAVVPGLGAMLDLDDGRCLSIETSEEQAEALVRALDLDVGRRRFETRFRPSLWRPLLTGSGIAALYALAIQLAPKARYLTGPDVVIFALATLTLIAGVVMSTRPPRVEVGADGLTIRRRVGSRFIPFSEVARVAMDGRTLTLELHGGNRTRIAASSKNEPQLRAAGRRIALGLAAHADEAAAPARLALLARGPRAVQAWRADLAKLVQQDAGFRRAPLSRDDLEAILAAPSTSPEHRIAAGLALQALDGESAEPRIRVAAEACAQADLREALLAVAEGEQDLAAVEEALAQGSA